MIHTNRIVTVGEQESIIDRPIVLYRGDREVEIEFTLVGNEFTFSEEGNVIKSVNASHGQLVLNTPSGEHMFSELAECHEGKVVFVVTKEMIDEFIEMGFYSFQIRLYDSAEMKSRVTIPPVLSGFDIRNPIAAEDETNVVDQGIVDYARIFKDQSNEELPTFDWQGNYNKTEWAHHDVITENKMNKIEDALYSINANIKESDVVMLNALDNVKKDADKYVKEHMAEVEADVDEFERNLNTDVQQFKIDTNAAMTAHKNEVSDELESVNSQLEDNTNELTRINRQLKVNVLDFGAKGDGVTDDTDAIQNAINSIPTYKISSYFKPSLSNANGGVIYFPNGKYLVKGTLKFKGGLQFKGNGFNSIIIHVPNTECNLFEPDTDNFSWDIITLNVLWEDLAFEGDYSPSSDVGFSNSLIYLNHCGLCRINRCYFGSSKTGVYCYSDGVNPGGYYNVITSSSMRSCKVALDLSTDQFTVTDTNIAVPPTNKYCDYAVKVNKGGGVSFTNCAVEGQAKKALYYLSGCGTTINGGYSENNYTGGCYAEINLQAQMFGGVKIDGLFTNPTIKFLNLYSGDDFTTSYPISTGISINSKGDYINGVIINNTFDSDEGWEKNNNNLFTGEIITSNQMFSNKSYRMTRISEGRGFSIRQDISIPVPNAFFTVLVKRSSDDIGINGCYLLDNTTGKMKYLSILADYSNGWYLLGVWLPVPKKGHSYKIILGHPKSTPLESWIEFAQPSIYSNGINYFPIY